MAPSPIGGERDLWRLWEQRRLPAALHTRDGRALHVLFPGLANTGAGPDFTGALLRFDHGVAQRGDVELHLKSSSWSGHGHHLDPRYAGVILHVVLTDDGSPAFTAAGAALPMLVLGPLLEEPPAPDVHGGPCSRAGTQHPTPHVQALLYEAGLARFAARAQRWEGELAARPLEDCVLHAVLRAAGLGRNADACAALADALDGPTFESLLARVGAEKQVTAPAILLGMAGLLDQARAGEDLRQAWAAHREYWPGRPLDERQWQRFRLRPANLPEVRLQALAALLVEHGLRGFLDGIVDLLDREPPPTTAALVAALATRHATVGRDWALEAWANVFLPLLAAVGNAHERTSLAARATARYIALPGGGENRVLTRMRAIAGLPALPRRSVEQQGLMELWSRYCSRQACAECPLAGATTE